MAEEIVVYTPDQVARLANCTKQTIYKHLEENYFPNARVIGKRKWFIPQQDAIAYLGYDPRETTIRLAN